MNLGGQNYTSFRGVNLKDGMLRFAGSGAYISTLTIASSSVGDRAWSFVDKSGRFGVSGTFAVSLGAFGKGTSYNTAVTVTGITAEDGVVVSPCFGETGSGRVFVGAVAGAGVITMYYTNLTGTDHATSDLLTYAYTAIK